MNPSDLPCSFLNYWGYEFDLQGGGSMKNLEDALREMRERNARKKREENLD
jgi:hypothetical protein